MNSRQRRKLEADKHNEAYEIERVRWNSLTREQQIHEMVTKGVTSAWQYLKPQLDNFLGVDKTQ